MRNFNVHWNAIFCLYLLTFCLVSKSSSGFDPVQNEAGQDLERGKRNSVPSWFANCDGIQCYLQVLTFVTYRFPLPTTIELFDHLTKRFHDRDEMISELEHLKLETSKAKHLSQVVTKRMQIELDELMLELMDKEELEEGQKLLKFAESDSKHDQRWFNVRKFNLGLKRN